MNEIDLHDRQERGSRAEELLRNELMQEAFKVVHAEYVSEWLRTDAKDTQGRERLWQAVRSLGQIELHIRKVARDGKLASKDLATIKYLKR